MKSKKMFILCALLGVSFISAGTVAYIHNEVDTPVKAEAVGEDASYKAQDYLFLNYNGIDWGASNAVIAGWVYGDGVSGKWITFRSSVNTSDSKEVALFNGKTSSSIFFEKLDRTKYTTLILVRFENGSSVDWNSTKWNRVDGLNISGSNNYVYLTDWNAAGTSTMDFLTNSTTRDIYVKSESVANPYVYAFTEGVSYYGDNNYNSAYPGVKSALVSDNVYRVSINSSFNTIILNNKSSQTANISLITADASSTNGNIQGYTLKSDWNFSYGLISESPMTSSNFVLWLYRGDYFSSSDYTYVFHYWNDKGTINHEIFPTEVQVNRTEKHAKYVISSEAIGCKSQFKVYNSHGTYIASSIGKEFLSTNNNGEAQVTANDDEKKTVTVEYSKKSSNACSAAAAKTILENYYTCLSNDYNGYSQINEICANWGFNEETADIATTMMDDYASTADYAAGTKSNSISVSAKISEMKKMASLSSAQAVKLSTLINFNNNSTTVAVVTIASLISLAVIIALILRKRYLSVNK